MWTDRLVLVTYRDHALHAPCELVRPLACLADEVDLHFNGHVDERLWKLAGADVLGFQHA